jgi:hypothetical protein
MDLCVVATAGRGRLLAGDLGSRRNATFQLGYRLSIAPNGLQNDFGEMAGEKVPLLKRHGPCTEFRLRLSRQQPFPETEAGNANHKGEAKSRGRFCRASCGLTFLGPFLV